MRMFCGVRTFREALKECEELLQENQLSERGLKDISGGILACRDFLNHLLGRFDDALTWNEFKHSSAQEILGLICRS